MDRGEPGLAGDGKILVDQKYGGNLLQVAGNRRGMEDRVPRGGLDPQRLAGEEGGGNLVEVPVERRHMEHRFAADVPAVQVGRVQVFRRDPVDRAVFRRLVKERVSRVVGVLEDFRRQDPRGDLREVPVGGSGVEDRIARVAAEGEVLNGQNAGRNLVQVTAIMAS